MADVHTTPSHAGTKRLRMEARVDLTPMVDLAFLLITFFMLTATLREQHAMNLNMPAKGDQADISADRILTMILDKEDRIFYYMGNAYETMTETDYSSDGIRTVIYSSERMVDEKYTDKRGLVCVIKMTDSANYRNMVDALDEMVITEVQNYAIQDLTEMENMAIKKQ